MPNFPNPYSTNLIDWLESQGHESFAQTGVPPLLAFSIGARLDGMSLPPAEVMHDWAEKVRLERLTLVQSIQIFIDYAKLLEWADSKILAALLVSPNTSVTELEDRLKREVVRLQSRETTDRDF